MASSLQLEAREPWDVPERPRHVGAAIRPEAVAPEQQRGEPRHMREGRSQVGGAGGAQAVVSDVEVREQRHAMKLRGQVRGSAGADFVVPCVVMGIRVGGGYETGQKQGSGKRCHPAT